MTSPIAPPPVPSLDEPLPPKIAGRSQGWLTRSRRYRVFSPAWARGRAMAVGTPVLLAMLVMEGGATFAARAGAIARATRDELGRITLHLRPHPARLAVSQAWAWRFKPM
jgi:hypothetical protein